MLLNRLFCPAAEVRAICGVVSTKSVKLRASVGRRAIRLSDTNWLAPVRLGERSGSACASAVTAPSSTAARRNVTSATRRWPRISTMSGTRPGSCPSARASSTYVPTCTFSKKNRPSSAERAAYRTPVALFVSVSDAEGTGSRASLVTLPATAAEVTPCAAARWNGGRRKKTANSESGQTNLFMAESPACATDRTGWSGAVNVPRPGNVVKQRSGKPPPQDVDGNPEQDHAHVEPEEQRLRNEVVAEDKERAQQKQRRDDRIAPRAVASLHGGQAAPQHEHRRHREGRSE